MKIFHWVLGIICFSISIICSFNNKTEIGIPLLLFGWIFNLKAEIENIKEKIRID